MDIKRRNTFTGSNNIAKAERLPEGAVVEAINVDFTAGGKAELRAGFEPVREEADTRAVFEMGGDALALIVAGQLIKVTPVGETLLGAVADGPVAAVWHAGELFLNTVADSVRIGVSRRSWAVPAPAFDVGVEAGSMRPGIYKVAVTAVEAGIESGCQPAIISVGEGEAIRVNVDDARDCRLYCSTPNGLTLYHQGIAYGTNKIPPRILDDSARLETAGLYSLPFCEHLISHQALIVGAQGKFLYHTHPMWPHLHNPESDYIPFPAPITLLASVEAGVFVCADKTYFITGLGGPDMTSRTVLEFGGIGGTELTLPDGSVAWFSRYGQVIGRADGSVELPNRQSYAPLTAPRGAAGLLEHNGNQMVVTTMQGGVSGSGLRSADHIDLEVIQ